MRPARPISCGGPGCTAVPAHGDGVLLANQLGFELQKHTINHIQQDDPFDTDRHSHRTIPVPTNFSRNIRNQYYIQQLPKDVHGSVTDIVHHLVQASIRNHNPQHPVPPHTQPGNIIHSITWAGCPRADRACLRDISQEGTTRAFRRTSRTVITAQRHYPSHASPHFLRLHHGDPIVPEEHCAIPIPSITEYMQERYTKLPESKRDRIRSNVQHIMHDYPRDLGTQWQWNNVTRRKPIPTIEKVEYEPTPDAVPLPQKTAGTIHFGSYTFQAITPHYDQWTQTDTDTHPETTTTITYPQLLETIKRLEKQLGTTFQ